MRKFKHRRVLGAAIRSYRGQIGWTLEKLAEKADLNPKYLGEVERGTVNVSADALVRLAKALRVRLRDLVYDV